MTTIICECLGSGTHRRGNVSEKDLEFVKMALEEARLGMSGGGIPIAAVLVDRGGSVLGKGHNMRVQLNSPILHGETSCLANCGRLLPSVISESVMYTTLSPCHLCAGALILYKIKRVVISENRSFLGAERLLELHGIEVVVVDHQETREMFEQWKAANPSLWDEDIGEDYSCKSKL